MNVLCIDIGGTQIKYTLFSEGIHGEFKSIDTPQTYSIEDMSNAIFSIIDGFLNNGITLAAVSISNCAQMRNHTVVQTATKFKYMGCNWRKIIFDRYNLEAFAYNDLHCAAMGEYNFGLEEKPSNFICLGIGTGINIGIIINGEVFYGDSGLSCYLDNCTDLDGNGKFKISSTASLLKEYAKLTGNDINGYTLVSLLKQGDSIALDCYNRWVLRVAHILKNVSYIFNINTIAVCGGILNADYPIFDEIKSAYLDVCVKAFSKDVNLYKSSLSSPQLYGAYAYALKHLNQPIQC